MHILKNNKWLLPAGALTALVLVAGVVGCGGGADRSDDAKARKMAAWIVDDVLDDLDATDEQRARVQAIKDRVLEKGLALKAERERTRAEVERILTSDRPDGARLHALVDDKARDLTAFAHDAADAALELHAVLDDDQREELAEILARHEKRRGHGWH